jgi:hypothetical protein
MVTAFDTGDKFWQPGCRNLSFFPFLAAKNFWSNF